MTSFPQYPTGWLCPRCHQVNAPTVTCCQCGQRTQAPFPPTVPWEPVITPVQPTRTGEPPPGMPHVYCGGRDVERYSTRPPAA